MGRPQPVSCKGSGRPLRTRFQPLRLEFLFPQVERQLLRNHQSVKSPENHRCHRQLAARTGHSLSKKTRQEAGFLLLPCYSNSMSLAADSSSQLSQAQRQSTQSSSPTDIGRHWTNEPRRFDSQNRTINLTQNFFRRAADKKSGDTGTSDGTHDYEFRP